MNRTFGRVTDRDCATGSAPALGRSGGAGGLGDLEAQPLGDGPAAYPRVVHAIRAKLAILVAPRSDPAREIDDRDPVLGRDGTEDLVVTRHPGRVRVRRPGGRRPAVD